MGTSRHDEQHLGYDVSEGAQRIKRQAISCGGANLHWSGTNVPEWTDRTKDTTEDKKREENQRDGIRRIWGKPGKCYFNE